MFVSNTSTLVLLAKIGCLAGFIEIAPKIIIPAQVRKEVLFQKDSYYALLIQKLIEEGKIKVENVRRERIKPIIASFRLDEGEAAAYALFDSKKHKAILTDDGELIKLCKLENVPFICAMAVVIKLYEKKILSKKEVHSKLKELNTVGRYSKVIYEYFLSEVK